MKKYVLRASLLMIVVYLLVIIFNITPLYYIGG